MCQESGACLICHLPLLLNILLIMLILDMYFCPSTRLITAKPLLGRTLTTFLAATPLPAAKQEVTSEVPDLGDSFVSSVWGYYSMFSKVTNESYFRTQTYI